MSTASLSVAPVAADLLAAYRPGDALFSSPRGALLAEGARAVVPTAGLADAAGVPARMAALLDGFGPDAVVVGALPFAAGGVGRLVVPERVLRAGPSVADADPDAHRSPDGDVAGTPLVGDAGPHADAIGGAAGRPTPPPHVAAAWAVRPIPAPEDYAAAVDAAVARMGRDAGSPLRKVVLARALELTAEEPIDPGAILRRLAERDPHGHAFAVDLGADGTLVGASPELLVSRHGDVVVAQPLAGSAPRRADAAADRSGADALLRSPKDLREHALVVDAVADALRPLCAALDVPESPSLVATNAMWHLGTTVVGRLADPATTALDLAVALHPTPAVCGTPPDAARAVIAELEPFDRGPYAGAVGWQDATGDGEWVVTIRCGVVRDRSLRVFAGAGVVPGSRGADELAETHAKLRTFLSVLGVEEAR
ncbi:isochorismate synthase [Patulibacter americanus]|uniref:isochorismate synthase n=1 Tax=Patulibacter americanus TaxID=588672 RepID=UPI0003B4F2CE|nr:isochorismate synthase [Patulibacter americanus]